MNTIIIYKNICRLIIKNRYIAAFALIFLVKNVVAQTSEWELKYIIKQRYYIDYVKPYYLPLFGKDSVKIKPEYVFLELFGNYFNNHRLFEIRLAGGHNVPMIYCISNKGEILENYFISYNALLSDSKVKLNNLEKSMLIYLAVGEKPVNEIVTSDTTFNKLLSSEDFKRYSIKNSRYEYYKHYPTIIRRKRVSFYVHRFNINNFKREIVKYTYHYKKGYLIKMEQLFITQAK